MDGDRSGHARVRAITLQPIGRGVSPLRERAHAPKQGSEGAPEARIEFDAAVADGLADLRAGQEVLVLTWLDRADRAVLRVHPRDDATLGLRGVFSTRSPDRPNPIGLHRVRILAVEGATVLRVADLEAIDGTPVLDVKPVLDRARER